MTGKEFVKYIKSGDIQGNAAAAIIGGVNFEADRLVLELSKHVKVNPIEDKRECCFEHACLQEDAIVERIEIEGVEFMHYKEELSILGIESFSDLAYKICRQSSPMKMILEIPKDKP